MSEIFEINATGTKGSQRVCRVSYALNNAQPVSSSIIGDQPLFYVDFEGAADDADDLLFDAADHAIFESEIETLKKEIQSYERRLADVTVASEDSVAKARIFFESIAAVSNTTNNLNTTTIETITHILSQSRLANAHLECANAHGIKIIHSSQISEAFYDRKSGTILINPVLDTADQILLMGRELRRHWQHRKGALIHPLLFTPDNAILINRAQSADLSVFMVRMAWELQLTGAKDAWNRIENSSLADLGHALAREAFLDFRTLNNGQASAAVFETWFLSERCRTEDKSLIKQMLADYRGYVFAGEDGQKSITSVVLNALGEMPYGKNYLAPHVKTILSDAVFTEVRDRSNANFLWFIKFERSFRETEQELQKQNGPAAPGVRPKAPSVNKNTQDQNYEKAQPTTGANPSNSNVVTLFEGFEKSGDNQPAQGRILPPNDPSKRRKNKGEKNDKNVIYLRQRSSD
jgi:hypothetical protein